MMCHDEVGNGISHSPHSDTSIISRGTLLYKLCVLARVFTSDATPVVGVRQSPTQSGSGLYAVSLGFVSFVRTLTMYGLGSLACGMGDLIMSPLSPSASGVGR